MHSGDHEKERAAVTGGARARAARQVARWFAGDGGTIRRARP
jgi:hypothetical protein